MTIGARVLLIPATAGLVIHSLSLDSGSYAYLILPCTPPRRKPATNMSRSPLGTRVNLWRRENRSQSLHIARRAVTIYSVITTSVGEFSLKHILSHTCGVFLLAVAAMANGGNESTQGSAFPREAKTLFEQKCSICHGLERSLSARKTAQEWGATTRRMAEKAPNRISAAEAETIASYLAKAHVVSLSEPGSPPSPSVHQWLTPALGACTWLVALGTMMAGLMRRRLGRAFRFHKYGALTAAVLWILHLLSMKWI